MGDKSTFTPTAVWKKNHSINVNRAWNTVSAFKMTVIIMLAFYDVDRLVEFPVGPRGAYSLDQEAGDAHTRPAGKSRHNTGPETILQACIAFSCAHTQAKTVQNVLGAGEFQVSFRSQAAQVNSPPGKHCTSRINGGEATALLSHGWTIRV